MKVLALACMVLSAFLPDQATPQAPASAPDFAGSWVIDQAKTAQASGTPFRPHGVQAIYKITQTATTITWEMRETGMNNDKAGKLASRIVWRLDGEPSKNQPGVELTSPPTLQTYVTTWKDGKLTNTITWHDERGDQIKTETWWREGPWLVSFTSWTYYNGSPVRITLYFKRA